MLEGYRFNKMMVLLIITLLFGSIFVTFGCLEDDESRTPEDTLIEFFKSVDSEDGKEAMDLFASRFVDNESIEEKMKQMKRDISNGNFTVEEYEIKDVELEEDMNQTEREDMDKFANFCENYTDKDVQSYCRIKVNMTETFSSGENYTGEVRLPLVKIDDSWYLTNILYAKYLYESLPTGGPDR